MVLPVFYGMGDYWDLLRGCFGSYFDLLGFLCHATALPALVSLSNHGRPIAFRGAMTCQWEALCYDYLVRIGVLRWQCLFIGRVNWRERRAKKVGFCRFSGLRIGIVRLLRSSCRVFTAALLVAFDCECYCFRSETLLFSSEKSIVFE